MGPEPVAMGHSRRFTATGESAVAELEPYSSAAAKLLRLHGARYHVSPMAIILPDDRMLASDSQWYGSNPADHWIFSKLWLGRPRRLEGEAFLFSGICSPSYYHLLIDALPRYWLLKKAGASLASFDWVICDGKRDGFGVPFLDGVGVPAERRIYAERGHYYPSCLALLSIGWLPAPWLLPAIDEAFNDAGFIESGTVDYPRRFYVSRSRAAFRRVHNEPEVLRLLDRTGFVPVHLEDLSYGDQRALFRQAKAVIAPHGAGLANLVFCRPGTHVLEIRHETHLQDHWDAFQRLAGIAGLVHACLEVGGPPDRAQSGSKPYHRDLFVPLARLQKIIDDYFQV